MKFKIFTLKTAMLATLFAAVSSASAIGIQVNRPIDCASDCMKGVVMLDDVTMALLVNAPDSDAAESVEFIRLIKPETERGWNALTPRIALMGIAGFNTTAPRSIVTARRADTVKTDRFLLPVAKIDAAIDRTGAGVQMNAIFDDDRVRVNETSTDICSTTDKRQYCVRIENVGRANSPQKMFAASGFEKNTIQAFESHSPSPGSSEWNKMLLSFEVEVIDRKPLAIDGARYIRVKARKIIIHNLDVILSSSLG